ncbi:MAG TPA: hypothetical protein P5186_13015 [Candidatus Paceibacterota bacterium]|nr:hypothetical protein [Verrucomicrobiota bacterium]HRY48961.1 hypothetical protein [Candidatus Paceibacterota bacterium]HSA03695.1 hypothetical protein [Candidatus Paceibacterota bacterium]
MITFAHLLAASGWVGSGQEREDRASGHAEKAFVLRDGLRDRGTEKSCESRLRFQFPAHQQHGLWR